MNCKDKLACVVLSDEGYAAKALHTVRDLRSNGQWHGDIVYVCVDCEARPEIIAEHVIVRRVKHLDTSNLVAQLRAFPLRTADDGRHFGKLTQWDKLQLFDPWFKQWDYMLYLDAGMRVRGSVAPLFEQRTPGKFIAPRDKPRGDKVFVTQLDLGANQEATKRLLRTFGTEMLLEHYFLNCVWLMDTRIIDTCNLEMLREGMNAYPLFMTNEMALLNLYLHFRHGLWKPMKLTDEKTGRVLFAWSESIYPEKAASAFHLVKYSLF